MAKSEFGESTEGIEFSVDGKLIGGPVSAWKRIRTEEGVIISGAHEFINTPRADGVYPRYEFRIPSKAHADIYLDVDGEEKVYTAMGSDDARLGSEFSVKKLQLYVSSREWSDDAKDWGDMHTGQWIEWDLDLIPPTQVGPWRVMGKTSDFEYVTEDTTEDIDPGIGTTGGHTSTDADGTGYTGPTSYTDDRDYGIDDSDHYYPTKPKKNDHKFLKLALAGALVLGGVQVLGGLSNNTGVNNPSEKPLPTPFTLNIGNTYQMDFKPIPDCTLGMQRNCIDAIKTIQDSKKQDAWLYDPTVNLSVYMQFSLKSVNNQQLNYGNYQNCFNARYILIDKSNNSILQTDNFDIGTGTQPKFQAGKHYELVIDIPCGQTSSYELFAEEVE